MSTIHFDGVAFKLCLYLAANPGAALFSEEICDRWSVRRNLLSARLKPARARGWVVANKVPGERQYFYSAGPALEALMGRPS